MRVQGSAMLQHRMGDQFQWNGIMGGSEHSDVHSEFHNTKQLQNNVNTRRQSLILCTNSQLRLVMPCKEVPNTAHQGAATKIWGDTSDPPHAWAVSLRTCTYSLITRYHAWDQGVMLGFQGAWDH